MNAQRIASTQNMTVLEVLALPMDLYVIVAAAHNSRIADQNAAARAATK